MAVDIIAGDWTEDGERKMRVRLRRCSPTKKVGCREKWIAPDRKLEPARLGQQRSN
jgi:hypothetical protein